MVEYVGAAFQSLFTWDVLSAILLGTVIGLLIGAMPGLGSSMGVALMLPFTYGMSALSAISMLIALSQSCQLGGSLPAILINTPGTSASAATAVDGYLLSRQGKAADAIVMAILASCFGGLFGGLVLLLIAPMLANVALEFGPMEYMAIAIFGLTLISSLSDDMLKGLVTGLLGLMIGCIGMNSVTGTIRMTGGNLQLIEGIRLIWLIIGLFGGSQVFLLARDSFQEAVSLDDKIGREPFWKPVVRVAKHMVKSWKVTLLGSAVGTGIGILPGIGGAIGCWIAYSNCKKVSREKEKFGKGALDGILASETSNNAVICGALVPALTLSIPGNATTAILIGALIMHGLVPSPQLFSDPASATTAYGIILSNTLSCLVFTVAGIFLVKFFARISKVGNADLWAPVMMFAVIGGFLETQTVQGVYFMLLISVLALILRLAKFPMIPLLLGFILGPIVEKNLYRGLVISGNTGAGLLHYFWQRPIAVVFIAITVGTLIVGAFRFTKKTKTGSVEDDPNAE